MQVSGAADLDRWRHAVEQTITEMGLGIPEIHKAGRAIAFKPVQDVPVDCHTGDFHEFVNIELNRPFTDHELPIRFTVLPRNDGSHSLLAIYDHWIADSRAMRELMHRIWERYRSADGSTNLLPLTLKAPHFNELYRKHIGYLYRSMSLRESLKNVIRHRKAHRMNLVDPRDFTSHMIYTPLPPGVITRLHAFAKAHGASVNDAFIAVLAQTMGEYTAAERYRPRRKKMHFTRDRVSLGTIVDIRDAAKQSLDQVFGLYLSSYTVLVDKPEKRDLAELMKAVAARTRKIKRNNGAVKLYTAFMTARLTWDLFPKIGKGHLQGQLFQKNVPMSAGISNVNMTKSWVDEIPAGHRNGDKAPVVLDYLRISPTGPLIPLVFTLTTIRDRLSLCCTYRTTAFTPERAQHVVNEFTRRLGEVRP